MKTEEKKVVSINEENRFHKARKAIGHISRKQNKDVGVAAVIWAHSRGEKNYDEELQDFLAYTAYLQKQTTAGNNRVKEYFGEVKA